MKRAHRAIPCPQVGWASVSLSLWRARRGTHSPLKVTSPALTSAHSSWVSERKGPIVSWARKLEMLHLLHFFFCPAHSNNEDNLVQKSNQGFWHELSCSDPWSLLSHHCQVGQIVIRARSSPGEAQGQLSPAWCLVFLLLTHCGLHTSFRGPAGGTGPQLPHHPASKWCLYCNRGILFSFSVFLPILQYLIIIF